MADHNQGCRLLHQIALEPLDCLHVEVVGWLVEQQQIGLLQKDLAQGNAHLPAAGKIPHQLLGPLRGEADRGEQLVDPGIELVAMQGFETAVQPTQLVDQPIEVIWIGCGLLAGHGLLHLVLAEQHLSGFAECLEELFPHAALGVNVKFLLQIGDAGLPLLHHQAAAGLLQPGDDLHLGGLAGSVDAHQADPVANLHFPGDIAQDLAGGVDLADSFEAEHGMGVGVEVPIRAWCRLICPSPCAGHDQAP